LRRRSDEPAPHQAPADTSAWPGARSRLADQLRVVAEADDGLTAGSVRARLPLVLDAVDRLVDRAAQAHADWQPVHDAAVARQASDRAALQRYADAVRGTGAEWTALRTEVTALASSPADNASAVQRLTALSATADRLLGTLLSGGPPDGVGPAHQGLVSAVEPLAATLATVLDELRDAECQDCPAADAPAWRSLVRGADQSAAWGSASTGWETAVADADAAIAARELPPPPDA
jgi:hypothetical protein